MEKKETLWAILSDNTIIIAIAPLLGYALALLFETGYLGYYDLPAEVVEVGPLRFLTTTLVALPAITIVWTLISIAIAIIRAKHPLILTVVFWLLMLAAGYALIVELANKRYSILFALTAPLISIFHRAVKRALNKKPIVQRVPLLRDAYQGASETVDDATNLASKIWWPMIGAVLVIVCTMSAGKYMAQLNAPDAWALDNAEPWVLLRRYGDTYLFKEYDPLTMELKASFRITKIGDGKNFDLYKVRLKRVQEND